LYIAGRTSSRNFPVSLNAYDTTGPTQVDQDYFDAFVSSITWQTGDYRGTYLGGSGGELIAKSNVRTTQESVTLLGGTGSLDFPVTVDAYQSTLRGIWDGFIVKLSRDLSILLYGSYIGGTHVDNYNAAYVENADSLWIVGGTLSIDLPTTPDAIQPGDNGLTSGFVQHFAIDTTSDTTSAANDISVPNEFALTVFPNPFNPTTTLSFRLPKAAYTELLIHNILGQQVERIDFGRLTAGAHQQQIGNSNWASGIYIATLKTPHHSKTTKLLLLR